MRRSSASILRRGSREGVTRCLARKPAFLIVDEPTLRKAGIGLVWIRRLALDAGAMAKRCLVDRVATPVRPGRPVASTEGEHDAWAVAGADDHVTRLRWAVHEIPRP